MDVARKALILLLAAAALPAVAQTFNVAPRAVCISNDAVTYRVVSNAAHPDYIVRIVPAATAPDIRVALVDTPDAADFLLVDDGERPAAPCPADGDRSVKTIVVSTNAPMADLTIALTGAPDEAQHRIFVRSERFSPEAAASLFAVMQARGDRRALAGR